MQVVGKVRLSRSPWTNEHSWHVTIRDAAGGSRRRSSRHGTRAFTIDFDFIDHRVIVRSSDGSVGNVPLEPQPVATFYHRLMDELVRLDLPVTIHTKPNEVADPIRFEQDEVHRAYDRDYANRFWRITLQAERVFKGSRTVHRQVRCTCSGALPTWRSPGFGTASPRTSRRCPDLPDWVAREAYSHEVSSCGFWPGGGPIPYPAFYAYAYPEPPGFPTATVRPATAFYSNDLREFVLPYDAVRTAAAPDEMLLDFLQTTYEAAAELGKWDRKALESSGAPGPQLKQEV
jgi:hypothetical protein